MFLLTEVTGVCYVFDTLMEMIEKPITTTFTSARSSSSQALVISQQFLTIQKYWGVCSCNKWGRKGVQETLCLFSWLSSVQSINFIKRHLLCCWLWIWSNCQDISSINSTLGALIGNPYNRLLFRRLYFSRLKRSKYSKNW